MLLFTQIDDVRVFCVRDVARFARVVGRVNEKRLHRQGDQIARRKGVFPRVSEISTKIILQCVLPSITISGHWLLEYSRGVFVFCLSFAVEIADIDHRRYF